MSESLSTAGVVRIVHGANDEEFAVAGRSVRTLQAALTDAFNVPADAAAYVNGEPVVASYILQPGDTLEFCKHRGNKGVRRMLTRADILGAYTGYPAAVMDELFSVLPPDEAGGDGQGMWHESAVDDWLDERYARLRDDDGHDRVIPPSGVRINGVVYDGLTLIEWRLLDKLLSARPPSVPVDDVIEHLYSDDASTISTDNRLKQAIKRLNCKGERRWPFTVHVGNGFVSLVK